MALHPDRARAWLDVMTELPIRVGDVVRDDPEHPARPMAVCTLGALIEAARRDGQPLALRRDPDPVTRSAELMFVVTDGSPRSPLAVAEDWLGLLTCTVVFRQADLPLALATRIRDRVRNTAAGISDRHAADVDAQWRRTSGVKVWWPCDHGAGRRDIADALRVTLRVDAELVPGTAAYEALSAAQSAAEAVSWRSGTPDAAASVSAPVGAPA